jgi:hypothetical protein
MASNSNDSLSQRESRLADIASLGGEAALSGLLSRFAGQLEDLLKQSEWSGADIHRVVGLSGMLGFGVVEETWRRIEDDEHPTSEAKDAARAAAAEAIAYVHGRKGP